jgi:hypothetical protein
MLYRQKFNTFIRIFDNNVGYITSKSDFGDRVTEDSGAVFLKALSRRPKSLADITEETAKVFIGVDKATLQNDIAEFYAVLEEDGFFVSGSTVEELDRKDMRFLYSALEPKIIKRDFTPIVRRAQKIAQEYLVEHFKDSCS